jgi:hypothetical protein
MSEKLKEAIADGLMPNNRGLRNKGRATRRSKSQTPMKPMKAPSKQQKKKK